MRRSFQHIAKFSKASLLLTLGPFSLLRSRLRGPVVHLCATLCIAAEDGLYHSCCFRIWRIVSEDSPHAFKISSSRYFLLPPSFISLRSLRISVIPWIVR